LLKDQNKGLVYQGDEALAQFKQGRGGGVVHLVTVKAHDDEPRDDRSERRERRRQARKEAIRKHGATLGEVYRNAILKRQRKNRPRTAPDGR
jgi:hypothetical protein